MIQGECKQFCPRRTINLYWTDLRMHSEVGRFPQMSSRTFFFVKVTVKLCKLKSAGYRTLERKRLIAVYRWVRVEMSGNEDVVCSDPLATQFRKITPLVIHKWRIKTKWSQTVVTRTMQKANIILKSLTIALSPVGRCGKQASAQVRSQSNRRPFTPRDLASLWDRTPNRSWNRGVWTGLLDFWPLTHGIRQTANSNCSH